MGVTTMRVWAVDQPGQIDAHHLQQVERAVPVPGPGQIRIAVRVCGICRTDLHLAEGDLAPRHRLVTPGHEVVGTIDELGAGALRFGLGDRVGVPWLAGTCGVCRYCVAGRENLCLAPTFTGWDVDGGYRALLRAELPPGGRLGIYGFGASAHLTAQIALSQGATVHVLTRALEAQRRALELGAASANGAADMPPEPLDAAILFAPVGTLVLPALAALDRGGTLAIAGIHLTDIPVLNYEAHLFEERTLRSVTANTREDGAAFLELAARIGVKVTTTPYRFDQANEALSDLANDRVNGAAVLTDSGGPAEPQS